MSLGKLKVIPTLEKIKAGLGAAGMAAVGVEAFGPRIVGAAVFVGFGPVISLVAAVASAVVAGYLTTVSEKEAALESQAAEVGVRTNDDH